MKEVKINPLILTLLIVLAILGIISFIILLSNPTLITVIFGNNSIFNFNNTIKPPIIIGECNVDSDCPQTACVRSLNCPAIVCENRKCVAKNPIPSNALSCNSNDDCILYNADLGFDNCCGDYIINNSESKWQPINRLYYTNKVNEVCANDMRGYQCSAMPIRIIDDSYYSSCSNNVCIKLHK